jgi:hypothetical protein
MHLVPSLPSIRRSLLPALACCLLLGACSLPPNPLPEQMSAEFTPGMSLDDARQRLTAHGTTFSVKTDAECMALVERSPNVSQLRPRGGPCVFGKIMGKPEGLLGGHSDVILQLVFDGRGTLVDAHFEEIRQLF